MDYATAPPHHTRRLLTIGVTLGAHLALLFAWQSQRPGTQPEAPRLQVWFVPTPKSEPAAPAHPATRLTVVRTKPSRPVSAPVKPPPLQAPQAPESMAPPAADAALEAAPDAAEIARKARRDIGAIDRDMRKEIPKNLVRAPADSPHKRMVRGMELANEKAPPGLFEAPKIREVIDAGQMGRKRYRVITARGTYCLTYDANHTPNGKDVIANGMSQRFSSCPIPMGRNFGEDLPPTTQP